MKNIASTGLSNCHKAEMRVVGDETMHYECTVCGEACDIWNPTSPVNESWEKEFDERFVYESSIRGGSWRFLSKEEGELIKSFLRPFLSTARQEERARLKSIFDTALKSANDGDDVVDAMNKEFDSLTSKGGKE